MNQTRPERVLIVGDTILLLWSPAYTETLYFDGTKVPAAPSGTQEQAHTARSLGYGDDVPRMVQEHEVLHTLLAEARDLPVSPVLWDVAHGVRVEGRRLEEHYQEEREVLALQRYLNTGDRNQDPGGVLSALDFEIDLDAVRERALELLNPTTPNRLEAA